MGETAAPIGTGSGGMVASIVGWLVGGTLLMVGWFVAALPDQESELGAYHDPNAGVPPLAALCGWFIGGIVGTCVALAVAKHPRWLRTGGILAALSAVVFLPIAFLVAFLSAFGAVLILLPLLVGWGVVVPPVARRWATSADRRAERHRRSLLPPPPAAPRPPPVPDGPPIDPNLPAIAPWEDLGG